MKFVLVALVCVALAAPVSARTAGGPTNAGLNPFERSQASEAAAGQPAEGERLICRRVEGDASSRLGSRRVCRTAEQWRAAQRD